MANYCIIKEEFGSVRGAPVYYYTVKDTQEDEETPTAVMYCARTYEKIKEASIADIEPVSEALIDFEEFFPRLRYQPFMEEFYGKLIG